MDWLEVSVIVDGEMAEAVSEVLARFAPSGVVIESTSIEANLENEGRPVGPLRICAYLPTDENIEDTRQRIEESLWYLGRIRPLPEAEFKPLIEVNWAETWKKNYQPISIGKRLIIVPAWMEPPDKTRIPIHIDPGMAFGTGTHPTTQLCLEMLDDFTPPGQAVLDIGCGSGILSIAALKLGAGRAYGVDIEDEAIPAALGNARANGVLDQVEFALGSVEEIQSGIFAIRQTPLVMANILAAILERLLDAGLDQLITPGGILVLSGILEEQAPALHAKIKARGLELVKQKQIEDWVAMAVRRAKD